MTIGYLIVLILIAIWLINAIVCYAVGGGILYPKREDGYCVITVSINIAVLLLVVTYVIVFVAITYWDTPL